VTTIATPTTISSLSTTKSATWAEYIHHVEDSESQEERVFFDQGTLWIDMGNEGINHARFNELFTLILGFWFANQSDVKFDLLGGCVIEKPKMQGAAPDKMVYIGGDSPQWQLGESRRVNLDKWRVPDLVAEIADTTLAIDLDEKKQLYLALSIPEYWVIDVKGKQVLAFRLIDDKYQQINESVALMGLSIDLLEQTLNRLDRDNGNAALWFATQIQQNAINKPDILPS
jgi:Uma2 family endonuclease